MKQKELDKLYDALVKENDKVMEDLRKLLAKQKNEEEAVGGGFKGEREWARFMVLKYWLNWEISSLTSNDYSCTILSFVLPNHDIKLLLNM